VNGEDRQRGWLDVKKWVVPRSSRASLQMIIFLEYPECISQAPWPLLIYDPAASQKEARVSSDHLLRRGQRGRPSPTATSAGSGAPSRDDRGRDPPVSKYVKGVGATATVVVRPLDRWSDRAGIDRAISGSLSAARCDMWTASRGALCLYRDGYAALRAQASKPIYPSRYSTFRRSQSC
jgi:hypothetical protein